MNEHPGHPADVPAEPAGTTRRTLLRGAGGLAVALGTLRLAGRESAAPQRMRLAADNAALPDIQFDIARYLAPPQTLSDGGGKVLAQMPPRHTAFVTAALKRTPALADQRMLSHALATIESHYPFAPGGIIMFAAYGLPYFKRLNQSLVASHLPRLASDHTRFALEEAVPGPTDVSPRNPGIIKQTFNVPVRIEHNDLLLTVRSDNPGHVADVLSWLGGSDSLAGQPVPSPPLLRHLATVTSSRAMFVQMGMPASIAKAQRLQYAFMVNPGSTMWMGFISQQVDGAGPAQICTFAGNSSARLTTAAPGDYFDNGAIQHLSHLIQDMAQFYVLGEPYTERVQYAFRSDPIPSPGHSDQYTRGGGPAILDNLFKGPGDALENARGIGTYDGQRRLGHLTCLQRVSRAPDGTPIHIRMDGPGFDALDVPDGSRQPKLQFTMFVPTADFFATMRINQASLDLQDQYQVDSARNGLERFLTATRRQNFLVPPRRHRSFPLVELA